MECNVRIGSSNSSSFSAYTSGGAGCVVCNVDLESDASAGMWYR